MVWPDISSMLKRYIEFPVTWWRFFVMLQSMRAHGEYMGDWVRMIRSSFRLAIAYTA